MSWVRLKIAKGFCRAQKISFSANVEKILNGEERQLTRSEYNRAMVSALDARAGWSGEGNTILYEKTGQSFLVDDKSFTEVVYEGLILEGIIIKGTDDDEKVQEIISEMFDTDNNQKEEGQSIFHKIMGIENTEQLDISKDDTFEEEGAIDEVTHIKYCSQCAKEISDNDNFCIHCGNKCGSGIDDSEKEDANVVNEDNETHSSIQESPKPISKNDKIGEEIEAPEISADESDATLRSVLLDSFSDLVGDLPIKGGWGYSREDAIIIDKKDSIVDQSLPFAGTKIEYVIAKYRAFIELIIARDSDEKYCNVQSNMIKQELVHHDGRSYDVLSYEITALSPHHCNEWNEMVKEADDARTINFEELTADEINDSKKKEQAFIAKDVAFRKRSDDDRIWYSTKLWFDITSFYGQGLVMPGEGQDFTNAHSLSEESIDNRFDFVKNLKGIEDTTIPEDFGREEYLAEKIATLTYFHNRITILAAMDTGILKRRIDGLDEYSHKFFDDELVIISIFLTIWVGHNLGMSDKVKEEVRFRVYRYMIKEKIINDSAELEVFDTMVENQYDAYYKIIKNDVGLAHAMAGNMKGFYEAIKDGDRKNLLLAQTMINNLFYLGEEESDETSYLMALMKIIGTHLEITSLAIKEAKKEYDNEES